MWNESDDQWPGTFNEGVPMTEEKVRDWMDKEACLMRLVVQERDNGKIVGYGSLWETPGRDDSCYVELLNVHPEHQKRSLARRMLAQMVDWAVENNYRRMAISTWPGNLKSVPLYKKVGYFWIPDTAVRMENYIPAVRQLPVAGAFFERHDWYGAFRRELEQVEDDLRHPATGDMKVYIYRWEEDGEFLEAVIDREGQALTGLETTDFAVYAVVGESEPAQGIVYPVCWKVTNKRDEPVDVSVLADGEGSIKLSHRASLTLAAGEERVVEATFTCAADAPLPVRNKPAPKIKTTMVIGGGSAPGSEQCVMELGTGLRYRPAVEIGAEPEFPSLLPGQQKQVHLQLRNRTDRALRGTVKITPQPGLATDWMAREFEVGPKGYVGLPLAVTCQGTLTAPLLATATFMDDGQEVTTPPQRIPLLVTPLGGVSACRDKDKLVIENDFFQLVCKVNGGQCRVWSKARQRNDSVISEEIGPPFDPWDLWEKQYDLALEQGRGWAKAVATAKSGRFPGLTVNREVTVTGSPLVQVRYRLVNEGARPYKLQVRPRVRLGGKEAGCTALPHRERLVVERAAEFPASDGDLPKKPERLAEQWMASTHEGQVVGVIWNQDVVEHENWWENLFLYLSERTLEPQSAVEVGPLYLYFGPGDWQDVRRSWQRTVGQVARRGEAQPQTGRPHAFGFSPSPLVTLNGRVEAQLYADNVCERDLQGKIVIEPPAGWAVDRAECAMEGLNHEKALREPVCLTAQNGRVGAFEGRLHFNGTQFDETCPFAVIRLGDEDAVVQVTEREEAGQGVWGIANGRCTWTVAPAYHGGIVAWHESCGQEAQIPNHLMTAFPENGEIGWLKPWLGGIWPMIIALDSNAWPGKLHEETFIAAPLEMTDARGIVWRGVQVAASLKRKDFEGLRVEVAYLTVGHSNVLKAVYRLVNETSAYRRLRPGLLTYCQVDGAYKDTVLYGEGYQRKRTPQTPWLTVGPWGAAVNPQSGRAMVMVGGSGKKGVELSDWGVDGGHLMFYNSVVLEPLGSHELVTYLALAESLEEAKRYEALADHE
jgi:GNAT superfamily N-acetyltransferase